jgi:hypothetical protein
MKFANANKLDRKSGGSPTIAFSIRQGTAGIIELSGRPRESFANSGSHAACAALPTYLRLLSLIT